MALINRLAIVFIVFLPIISAGCDYQKCADLANGKDPNFAKFISRPFFSSKQFHNNKFVTGSYHTVAERFQAHITMYCQDVNELSECLRNCPGPREEIHHSQNGISSSQLFIHYSEILSPVCENSTAWSWWESGSFKSGAFEGGAFEGGACMEWYAMSQKLPYTNAVNGGDSSSDGHKFEIPSFSLPGIPFSFKHNQLGFPLWEHTTARIDQLCEERLTYLKKYEPLIRYKCGMAGTDTLLRMQKEALQSFGRRLEKNDAIRSGHCKKLVEYVESNLRTEYSAWASIKSFFSVMWSGGLDEIK